MKDRLYRSRLNRYLGGVSAGLGEYFSLDPIIVRILFIVLTLSSLGFGGILLYIVLWIVVPEEPYTRYRAKAEAAGSNTQTETEPQQNGQTADTDKTESKTTYQKASQGQILAGIIFIGFGTILLVNQLFPRIDFDIFFPIALVAIGGAIVISSLNKH